MKVASWLVVVLAVLNAGCGKSRPEDHQASPEEQEAFKVMNQIRAAEELPQLKLSPPLGVAARAHALRLAEEQATDLDKGQERLHKELAALGYNPGTTAKIVVTIDQLKIKQTLESFVLNVEKRDRMLKPDSEEFAAGIVQFEGKGKFYVSLLFATPRNR